METLDKLKMVKSNLEDLSVFMEEVGVSPEKVQSFLRDMEWLMAKAEANHRLENRLQVVDLAIQDLRDTFTPYEKERFDIKYTHTGIINGAVRAINYRQHLKQ